MESHGNTFVHWFELINEREKISLTRFFSVSGMSQTLLIKLNNFINTTANHARKNN